MKYIISPLIFKSSQLLVAILMLATFSYAQTGVTSSPSKLFYKFPAGGTGTQKLIIQNPHDKDLEIGLTVNDWQFDSTGSNSIFDAGTLKNSAANWITILGGTYLVLKPYERREVSVVLTAPAEEDKDVPVHVAMIYITQLNPGNSKSETGANIKVTVRMGTKVYHSYDVAPERDIDVVDFKYDNSKQNPDSVDVLVLRVENKSKTWIDGKTKIELLNTGTGKKIKLDGTNFYQLPGDNTIVRVRLKDKIPAGKYTATAMVNYGDKDELKVAELDFAINK